MRRAVIVFFLAATFLTAGCASTGTYFKDRALDFADCFKADVGTGFGLGVHLKATEAASAGLGVSVMNKCGFKGRNVGKWKDIHLSWPVTNAGFLVRELEWLGDNSDNTSCGNFHPSGNSRDDAEVIGAILAAMFIGPFLIPADMAMIGVTEQGPILMDDMSGISEFRKPRMFFPGGYASESVFFFNRGYFFPRRKFPRPRILPVNAFDIEVGVNLGFVGAHAGFSPGQFTDFIIGWFGVDIAGDDTRSRKKKKDNTLMRKNTGK